MNRKTYKLFGRVILEIETDQDAIHKVKNKKSGNGYILSISEQDKANYKKNGNFEKRA